MKLVLVLIITSLFSITNSSAQYFMKYFGGSLDERCAGMVMNQGNIWFGGHSNDNFDQEYDIQIIKTDTAGNLHWELQFFYPGFQLVNAIVQGDPNELYIAGETGSFGTSSEAFLLKADTSGNLLWYQTYSGLGNSQAKSLLVNPDKTIMIIGFRSDSTGSNDIWLAKLDPSGGLIWEQTYGGRDNDYGMNVIPVHGGDYIFTADTRSNTMGGYDIYVSRIDSIGNVKWNILLGDSLNNGCQGAIKTQDGNLLVFGETEIYPGSPFNYFLSKVDTAGNILWTQTPGGAGSDAAFAAVEINNGYVFGGYSNSDSPGAPVRGVLFRTDSSGNIISEVVHGSGGIHIVYSVYMTPGSGLFAGGSSTVNGNDVFLLHTDLNGVLSVKNTDYKSNYLIYPNPSEGSFVLEGVERGDKMMIFDLMGKCLYDVKVGTQKEFYTGLKSGYYMLKVLSSKGIHSLPLIISN